MSEQEPVLIPKKVLEQLESVRRYTRAEVLDIPTIRHVAMETEKPARRSDTEDRRREGIGLGLWIVRQLVRDSGAVRRPSTPGPCTATSVRQLAR